jgi:two-component system sensor histidine kinase TctE
MTVRADPVMLEEALTNLLDNALRHGGQGLSRIELSLDASDEAVTVTVRDDGIGIAPDKVETALSRFGQANPGEGSGLGLSIAEAVATRGGGSLDLRPADPRGLQVVLRLPAMAASGQRPAA